MRTAGLAGASRRRTGVTTTQRDHDARPAPDLVDRDFKATAANALGVAAQGSAPDALAARLRRQHPAIVGRIADGRLLLDVLAVDDAELTSLGEGVRHALRPEG